MPSVSIGIGKVKIKSGGGKQSGHKDLTETTKSIKVWHVKF